MFNKQNFCHVASNNRNEQKAGLFVYKTTDNLETVLTSGYFNEKIIDINLHDMIIHEKINNADKTDVERNLICVVERTLENVGTKLIKSNWEKTIDETIAEIQDDIETIQDDIDDIKAKDIDQDNRLDDLEENVAYKATDFATPITNTNKGITQAEETVLNNKIDLAANSGRMITSQGLWYAKMYAATTPQAAEDGTNYADFSQTDGQGNPIIVTYNRVNGAWVQDQTITPPADYDGYVPITSKIWDIPEQAGQQGGRILWNHESKEFTPYPQIISFDGANITNSTITTSTFEGSATLSGNSTVTMPQNPTGDQIVNKNYVDSIPAMAYHPDLFDHKWADHILNDTNWLRADTFSWQSGAVYQPAYQHLADDIDGKTLQSETIGTTTIQFYLADDGHKICPASEENNVAAIYADKGVAWYYIIDTTNEQFKLPRTKFAFTGIRTSVGTYIGAGLPNITGTWQSSSDSANVSGAVKLKATYTARGWDGTAGIGRTYEIDAYSASNVYGASDTVQPRATEQYLYFYVGGFTQTALENTAGVTTETLNNKADISTVTSLLTPDYTAGTEISASVTGTGYAAPKDGVIYYFTMPATNSVDVTVNGAYIMRKNSTSGNYSISGTVVVKKNDLFWMGRFDGGSVYFYPFKGA